MHWFLRSPFAILVGMIITVVLVGFTHDTLRANESPKPSQSPQHAASLAIQLCADENRPQHSSRASCYIKVFEEIGFTHGPEFAFDALAIIQKQDPEALGCHLIAHGIGRGTFAKDSQKWQEHFRSISKGCSYGGAHGVLEAHFTDARQGTLTKEMLPTICGLDAKGDCNHIVGHLALVETAGDIESAIDLCSVLENDRQRFVCFNGVFMENITVLNLIDHGYVSQELKNPAPRLEEFESLCRTYEGEKATACWKEIAHAVVARFRINPGPAFQFCNTAPTKDAQDYCKLHAIDMLNGKTDYDFPSITYMCKLEQSYDPGFEDQCYARMARSALLSTPQLGPRVAELCLSLSSQFQPSCFAQIGAVLYRYLKMEEGVLAELCQKTPQELYHYCIGTARL